MRRARISLPLGAQNVLSANRDPFQRLLGLWPANCARWVPISSRPVHQRAQTAPLAHLETTVVWSILMFARFAQLHGFQLRPRCSAPHAQRAATVLRLDLVSVLSAQQVPTPRLKGSIAPIVPPEPIKAAQAEPRAQSVRPELFHLRRLRHASMTLHRNQLLNQRHNPRSSQRSNQWSTQPHYRRRSPPRSLPPNPR